VATIEQNSAFGILLAAFRATPAEAMPSFHAAIPSVGTWSFWANRSGL
jgi:hypothetical protein